MSITVRLWSDPELKAIKEGTAHKNLITTFLNAGTFGEKEIAAYPYKLRRTYLVFFREGDPVTVYAVDDESAWWFICQEYEPDSVVAMDEETTTYRSVELPE